MIKRCRVSRSTSDTKQFPSVQVEFNDKVRTVEVIMPYGLAARIPADAMGHKLIINGNEDDQAAIFNTPTKRFKLDKEGEVAIGNPLSGSVVYFRENGDIEIIGKNAATMTVDADMNLTVASGLTIDADVTINGTVDVSGDVSLSSALSVSGVSTLGVTNTGAATATTLSIGGQSFTTHKHSGVQSGTSNTGGVV